MTTDPTAAETPSTSAARSASEKISAAEQRFHDEVRRASLRFAASVVLALMEQEERRDH